MDHVFVMLECLGHISVRGHGSCVCPVRGLRPHFWAWIIVLSVAVPRSGFQLTWATTMFILDSRYMQCFYLPERLYQISSWQRDYTCQRTQTMYFMISTERFWLLNSNGLHSTKSITTLFKPKTSFATSDRSFQKVASCLWICFTDVIFSSTIVNKTYLYTRQFIQ